ncbi:uncharacterized protein BDR25DRAFT_278147 [Lindgomyces ingoldianus]|uniref:Uncharacterized protein n=1 Tax=Lindgomyces ingoldianus TaxID=673940 RepID=A0ACB6RA50_9PLEO|nr:uncharacterized protein BDR25DRAFT_278147 [Lindgomyces ingoldianus]KAF2475615.1 hypothetical protein BDR25DRAFT_278147 [Lindgomyces ingoldianus]
MTGFIEAGAVISLISGVISITEATKTVYDATKDAKGQPDAFRQVAARLPLVNDILQISKERVQTLDMSAQDSLRPLLQSCNKKAQDLQKLFQRVIRKDDDKWYDRYKKVLGTLGKGAKVECLMEGILLDIQVLACERLTGAVTNAQMKELEEAINEMEKMPTSLPDEARSVHLTHSGSGDSVCIADQGTASFHKGSGDIYVISGGATIGRKN